MSECGIRRKKKLLAVADATVIFTPSHFGRIGMKVAAGNMMMNADLRSAQPREERLRLIGASLAVRIRLLMLSRFFVSLRRAAVFHSIIGRAGTSTPEAGDLEAPLSLSHAAIGGDGGSRTPGGDALNRSLAPAIPSPRAALGG